MGCTRLCQAAVSEDGGGHLCIVSHCCIEIRLHSLLCLGHCLKKFAKANRLIQFAVNTGCGAHSGSPHIHTDDTPS